MDQFHPDEQVDELGIVLNNLESEMFQKERLENELMNIRQFNGSNQLNMERTQARFMKELDEMRERISGVNELLEKHKKKRDDLMKPDDEGPKPEDVDYHKLLSGNLEIKYLEQKLRNEENNRQIQELMEEGSSDRQERIRRAEHGPPVCGVCETAYAERKNRIPRVLVCGHTICEACALKLAVSWCISCPICRDKTSVITVAKLPKNLALLEWLENAN